jgi:hypothetical protein
VTSTPESGKVAYENGKFCEKKLLELLPEFEYFGEEIDGVLTFNGKPAEVKSCQRTTHYKKGSCARSGRFWFKGSQHEELVDQDGVYIFLVHEGEILVSSRIVRASLLFPAFEGSKTASWPSIVNRLGVSTGPTARAARAC